MFNKKKEKDIIKGISHSYFKKLVDEKKSNEIRDIVQKIYKTGDRVDQTTAYGGKGSKTTIKDTNVSVYYDSGSEGDYANIAIGNSGVWSSKYGIFAKIINK